MALDPRRGRRSSRVGRRSGSTRRCWRPARTSTSCGVEGAELEGIHYLRAFGNSDAIREEAEAAERVVLIGGSYIGCEVAASLRRTGTRSHDRDDRGGGAVADVRRGGRALLPRGARIDHGVEVLGGEELEAFEGDGRVQRGRDEERAHGRGRHGRRRRGGAARHDARRARRARGRRRDRLRPAARDLGAGDLRRRRRLLATTASSTAAGCGSSTGTSPCSRAATRPGRCSATPSRIARSRTSSATSPTGLARVRRSGLRLGRGRLARRPRRRRVQRLVSEDGVVRGALAVGRSEDLVHARTLIETGADVSAAARGARRPGFRARIGRPLTGIRPLCSARLRWAGATLRPGVTAARLALDEVVGVRIPGPQCTSLASSRERVQTPVREAPARTPLCYFGHVWTSISAGAWSR